MLNTAIRYQPILREIAQINPARVLEVGSGPEGLALFWRGSVTGVDVQFKRRVLHRPVQGSAIALPFANRSWPLTVCCDALEHLPAGLRSQAVDELMRVTEYRLLLAFPTGQAAQACYETMARTIRPPLPMWLQEHLLYGLPETTPIIHQLQGANWRTRVCWYEQVESHKRLMIWETGPVKFLTFGLALLLGPILPALLPPISCDTEPNGYLRILISASRCEST